MGASKKINITVTLSANLADELASAAAERGLSNSQALEEALRQWLYELRKDRQALEALSNPGEGRITQEDVEAWAESLDSDNPLPMPKPRQ